MSEENANVNTPANSDDEDLRLLQQQAKQGVTENQSPEESALLNQEMNIDFSDGGEYQGEHPEGKYPCQIVKISVKVGQEKTDPISGEKKGGTRYAALEWKILSGQRKNQRIFDNVMLEGKGLQRFHVLVSALGMYDKANKRFTGRLIDLMNQMAWISIVHREEEYPLGSGNRRKRARVDFAGYEPITHYPIPGDIRVDQIATENNASASSTNTDGQQTLPKISEEPTTEKQSSEKLELGSAGGQVAMPPW